MAAQPWGGSEGKRGSKNIDNRAITAALRPEEMTAPVATNGIHSIDRRYPYPCWSRSNRGRPATLALSRLQIHRKARDRFARASFCHSRDPSEARHQRQGDDTLYRAGSAAEPADSQSHVHTASNATAPGSKTLVATVVLLGVNGKDEGRLTTLREPSPPRATGAYTPRRGQRFPPAPIHPRAVPRARGRELHEARSSCRR